MDKTQMIMGANPKLNDLQIFLNENFDFRYNVLTDMPECKPKNTTTYRMIDKRLMNSLSFKAMMQGIDCKDADVKRFLFSDPKLGQPAWSHGRFHPIREVRLCNP